MVTFFIFSVKPLFLFGSRRGFVRGTTDKDTLFYQGEENMAKNGRKRKKAEGNLFPL